jgi:hypothetical protein
VVPTVCLQPPSPPLSHARIQDFVRFISLPPFPQTRCICVQPLLECSVPANSNSPNPSVSPSILPRSKHEGPHPKTFPRTLPPSVLNNFFTTFLHRVVEARHWIALHCRGPFLFVAPSIHPLFVSTYSIDPRLSLPL